VGTFIAIANSILTTLSRGVRVFSGLLDEYGGAAAAYSVRRLSSDYATPTNSEFSFGGALQFDGVNDYVSIGQNLSNVGDVTLSVWFKVNAFKGTYFSILGSDISTGSYLMVRDVSGQLQCQGFGIFGNKQTLEPSNLGIWNHLGIIKSGANFTVYMNGTNYGSAASSTLSTINLFGKYGTNNSFNPANGVMDEFVWWNTALTEAQILNQWNGGNGNSANIDVEPLLWYNCNEEDGSSTLVNSGSGGASYNGTLNNFDFDTCWVDGKANKGALLEIRRSSDNLVKNFYYDSNNELSLNSKDCNGTTLSSWIGSDDGFVRTWYDQSGNGNNAINITPTNQPQIVSSGSLVLLNGKVAVDFDGLNDVLQSVSANQMTNSAELYVVSVLNVETSGANEHAFGVSYTGSISNLMSLGSSADNYRFRYSVSAIFQGVSIPRGGSTDRILMSGNYDGVNLDININNNSSSSAQSIGTGTGEYFFIGRLATNNPFDGKMQESIIWTGDKTSVKSQIESNINTYYSIYSPPSGIGTWTIGTTFIIQ
jgi:hypothetical protein